MSSPCVAPDAESGKCKYKSCSYNKMHPDGTCICKGVDFEGSVKRGEKRHRNYLCSMERGI